MINLRGGADDAWLVGERDVSWFTGKAPGNKCPGENRMFGNNWVGRYEVYFGSATGNDLFCRM